MAGAPQDVVDSLRDGRSLPDSRLEALRAFTTSIVERRGEIRPEDTEKFLTAGFRSEQILEVLLGVAMKTLSNYVNHIAETPLDPQFQPFAWAGPGHRSSLK